MSKNTKSTALRGISRQTGRVHFEDFSGQNFERLAYAYATRTDWPEAEWLGQAGGDGGLDIWCPGNGGKWTVFLCANYQILTFAKVAADLAKLAKHARRPAAVFVVAGGIVSSALRAKIKARAKELKLPAVTVWSGPEFEEKIRVAAPDLLQRFCHGEEFPDDPAQLRAAVADAPQPEISGEAKQLLAAMAAEPDGNVLRTETHDGYGLTIGHKEFLPDTRERRIKAKWERAIDELLALGLIEEEGSSGQILAVTDAGYRMVEATGSLPGGKTPPFQAVPMGNPADYFRGIAKLIPETPFDGGPLTVTLPDRVCLFLRLQPHTAVPAIASAMAARDLAAKGRLWPMGLELGGTDWVRNGKGAFIYAGPHHDSTLTNFTQLFLNGELCGVDLRVASRVKQTGAERTNTIHYLRIYQVELTCALALANYLGFFREMLQHPAPYRIEAGLHGIQDCVLTTGFRTVGQAFEPSVVWSGTIQADDSDPARILLPFFKQVWDAFGVTRFPEADKHLQAGLRE